MNFTLRVSSDRLEDDVLQEYTRDLGSAINQETDVKAVHPESDPVPGGRGLEIELGTLLLTFLSSGTAAALLGVVKAYMDRDSSVEMELRREDGSQLKLRARNLEPQELERSLASAREFFGDL